MRLEVHLRRPELRVLVQRAGGLAPGEAEARALGLRSPSAPRFGRVVEALLATAPPRVHTAMRDGPRAPVPLEMSDAGGLALVALAEASRASISAALGALLRPPVASRAVEQAVLAVLEGHELGVTLYRVSSHVGPRASLALEQLMAAGRVVAVEQPRRARRYRVAPIPQPIETAVATSSAARAA